MREIKVIIHYDYTHTHLTSSFSMFFSEMSSGQLFKLFCIFCLYTSCNFWLIFIGFWVWLVW